MICCMRHPGPVSGFDIWVLPLDGGKRRPLFETRFEERWAQFSPDGRWVAYMSNQSGLRREIYVTDFPAASRTIPISTAGGNFPRWSRTGLELFYIAADNRITAATLSVGGGDLTVKSITPLFVAQPTEGLQRYFYDV